MFSEEEIWFYGDDGLLMKWRNLGYIDGDLPIKFQSALVRIANMSVDSDLLQSNHNTS